jgi:glycosyltransferase involved in cell wall biosynthesis
MSEALRKLSRIDNCGLRVVSDTLPAFSFLDELKIDFRKWSAKKELDDLRSFDIGIMPLANNEINRGKCGFKALLCMACGIPVVISPVGMNSEIVRDGENGFLADSVEQWFEKLDLLVGNKALRERLGRAGKETVDESYSVKVNLTKLLAVFREAARSEGERDGSL